MFNFCFFVHLSAFGVFDQYWVHVIDSLVHISHPEISPEQHRCFLLLNAAVEKELQRRYTEVVVSPPETRLGQYSKEEQQLKTTSSLIPSSCGTCKHYCTKTERQQTGKLLCYPSMNFQAMKRRLLYLVCWHFYLKIPRALTRGRIFLWLANLEAPDAVFAHFCQDYKLEIYLK